MRMMNNNKISKWNGNKWNGWCWQPKTRILAFLFDFQMQNIMIPTHERLYTTETIAVGRVLSSGNEPIIYYYCWCTKIELWCGPILGTVRFIFYLKSKDQTNSKETWQKCSRLFWKNEMNCINIHITKCRLRVAECTGSRLYDCIKCKIARNKKITPAPRYLPRLFTFHCSSKHHKIKWQPIMSKHRGKDVHSFGWETEDINSVYTQFQSQNVHKLSI